MLGLMKFGIAAPREAVSIRVFVSFSMPEILLKETLAESARLHIPAVLNGLHQNSMAKTASKIFKLSRDVPNLNLNIDPTAFERYSIHQVPALVVERQGRFDVIYGNLSLSEGLNRIINRGETGLTIEEIKEMHNG